MNQKQLEELFINMEELIFRVASIVTKYCPAVQPDMQATFDEWNRIVKDIMKE